MSVCIEAAPCCACIVPRAWKKRVEGLCANTLWGSGLPSSVIFQPLLIALLFCVLPLTSKRPRVRVLKELGNEIRLPDWVRSCSFSMTRPACCGCWFHDKSWRFELEVRDTGSVSARGLLWLSSESKGRFSLHSPCREDTGTLIYTASRSPGGSGGCSVPA